MHSVPNIGMIKKDDAVLNLASLTHTHSVLWSIGWAVGPSGPILPELVLTKEKRLEYQTRQSKKWKTIRMKFGSRNVSYL